MEITGGCLCRSIRYRIAVEPMMIRVCWCRVCQYLACGNGTVNLCFRSDALAVEGPLADYRSLADSGNVMRRGFCATCGTQLFSSAEARPHLVFVRAGSLDDPEIAKPVANIWVGSAPSWACMNESLPKHDRQPPPVA